MADFIANVKAKLDMAEAEAKLRSLTNGNHKISLSVDLKGGNADFNSLLNSMVNQAKSAGQNVGQSFSSAINQSLSAKSGNALAGLRDTLGKLKVDSGSISTITKDIQKMNIAISGIKTTAVGDKLKMTIDGVEKGTSNAVKVMKEFDLASGKFSKTSKTVSQSFKEIGKASQTASQFKVQDLNNRMVIWCNKNKEAARAYKSELQELNKALNSPGVTNGKVGELAQQFRSIDLDAKAKGFISSGNGMKGIVSTFDSIKKYTSYFFSFYTVLSQFKKGFDFVNQLDDAVTNISYTMNTSTGDMKGFTTQALDMAQDLKTSATTVLEATTLYANAKESIDSILTKAKPAVMLSNVTGMTGTESAKMLQSIMNQFDLTQDDLLGISDTIQSVSQSMAYDFSGGVKEIADGISVSGSVAKDAGLSLTEYSAMLGTIIEQTGLAGSQIGNAVKTIMTRTTKASSTSGTMEEDISKAEEALKSVGIQVRSSSGEFRDFDDTLGDLSKKWDTLSDVEKSNISYHLAGTRQTNILKSLMESWDEYEQRVNAASNLKDSPTMANQEKWAESMSGHMDALTAKAQSFWSAFINTETAKGTVDFAADMISGLEKLTNTFGSGAVVAGGLGIVSVIKSISATVKELHGMGQVASFSNLFPALSAGVRTFGMTVTATGESVSLLSRVMSGLWTVVSAHPIMAAVTAVGALAMAFDLFHTSAKEADANMEQAFNSFSQTTQNLESTKSELAQIEEKIGALQSKGTLTFVEESELSKLRATKELLQYKLDLEEKAQKRAANDAADAAVEAYEKNFKSDISRKATNQASKLIESGMSSPAAHAESDDVSSLIASRKYYQKLKRQASKSGDSEAVARYGEQIDYITSKIDTRTEKLVGYRENLEQLASYGTLTSEQQAVMDGITEDIEYIYSEIDPSKLKQIRFDEIFDRKPFQGVRDELLEMAKGSKGVGLSVEEVTNKYPMLVSAMKQAGIEVQDIVNNINSEAGIIDIKKIKKQLRKDFIPEMEGASEQVLAKFGNDWDNFTKDFSDKDFEILYNIKEGTDTSGWTIEDWKIAFEQATGAAEQMGQAVASIEKQVENSQKALKGIGAATSLITSQTTGKSISLSDFNSEELADYAAALEYSNGSMKMNVEMVREIQKAKAEEAIAVNDVTKAQQQAKYLENISQIELLEQRLAGLTDTKGEQALAIQSSIEALLTENDSIINQCSQLDILNASLREATGAYQNWLDKQNGSESGDMFDDTLGAMQHIDDVTQNTKSEMYGRIGRESYKAAVEFIIPESVDGENAQAVASYMDSIEGFFRHDKDGKRIGLDVADICQAAVNKGLMVVDQASGQYQLSGKMTMEKFAEGMNMSLPVIQSFFGEMEEFGAEFDWFKASDGTSYAGLTDALYEVTANAESIQARIDEINASPIRTTADIEELQRLNDALETAEIYKEQLSAKRINAFVGLDQQLSSAQTALNNLYRQQDAGIPVDASQILAAQQTVNNLVAQKEQLGTPTVMEIDVQIENAQAKIAQLQSQRAAALSAPYSPGTDHIAQSAQAQIDSLNHKIGSLQALKVSVETSQVAQAQAQVDKLNSTQLANKSVTVTANAGQAIANLATVKSYISTLPTSKTITITTNRVTSFSTTGGGGRLSTAEQAGAHGGYVGLNGTAHATGTANAKRTHYPHLVGYAHAKGSWGAKTGGVALLGELGPEILVNPSTGRWQTVGDNGAEFAYVPKNAIIFNHLQSQSLLERGFVNSRGTALASGTALATGVSGGISIQQANIASGKAHYSSASSTTSKIAKAVQNAAQTVKKAATATKDKTEELVDFIETRLKRAADKTEEYIDNAEKTSSMSGMLKNYNRALNNIAKEKALNQQAAGKYLAQANAVGLSKSLAKKVRDGSVDIGKYDNDMRDKISEYQKWYEKMLDCQKKLTDLAESEVEIRQKKLEGIVDKYELRINNASLRKDVREAELDYREKGGYSGFGSRQSALYKSALKDEKYIYEKTKNAASAYFKEYQRQLNSGGLKKNSKEWFEAQEQLKKYNIALYESKAAQEEYAEKLRHLPITKLEYAMNAMGRFAEQLKGLIGLKSARGEKISESDYLKQSKNNSDQINKQAELVKKYESEMKNYEYGSEKWEEFAEKAADAKNNILDLLEANEDLKDSIMESRWREFDDLHDKVENSLTEIEYLRDMLDDVKYDSEGNLTDAGKADLALVAQGMALNKKTIADYTAAIKKLDEQYANGAYSQDEYNERLNDYLDVIRDAASANHDYEQELVDKYIEQLEAQNDALKDEISLRKDALKKKKDYYDYDKSIRKKTRDLQMLQAQAAALEGVNTAEGKAKLAKLKAEIKDSQDGLDDAVRDHEVDFRINGLDEFANDLEGLLETSLNSVKDNVGKQKDIINQMLSSVTNDYSSAYGTIEETIKHSGVVLSDTTQGMIGNLNSAAGAAQLLANALANIGNVDISGVVSGIDTSNPNVNVDSHGHSTTDAEHLAGTQENPSNSAQNKPSSHTPLITKVTSVQLNKTSLSLKVGGSATLRATTSPAGATSVFQWTSSNAKVATVSNGKIKAIGKGSATITAKETVSGKKATCKVSVTGKSSSSSGGGGNKKPSSGGGSSKGDIWKGIPKDGSMKGNKNLDTSTSIFDRIAYNGYATGFANQKKLYNNLNGEKTHGAYKGTGKQNYWMVQELKKRGYAIGTDHASRGIHRIDELGREMIMDNQGHLMMFNGGEKVYTAEEARNLHELSKLNVPKSILEDLSKGQAISQPDVTPGYTISVEKLIEVKGNVDREVMPDLQNVAKELLKNKRFMEGTVQYMDKSIAKEARRTGIIPRVK